MPEQKPRKAYRTETPNVVDEWGLGPYSFRLLFHYRRWCGEHGTYNKTVRATAALINISPAQVTRARQELIDLELIRMNPDGSVSVTDIWDLNREWFVSGRNKSVSNSNKPVSVRNKLFLLETSPYRKNLFERNLLEDTTTTESEGGGGGDPRPALNEDTPQKPLSVYSLEEVTEWAEAEPGILMPDRFAKARWLDGKADSRIAAFRAKRAAKVEPVPPGEIAPERLPPEVVEEGVTMLVGLLEEGRSIEQLEEQFSGTFVPEQWTEMRAAALEGRRQRGENSGA